MNLTSKIESIWEYEVRDHFLPQFKIAYGPNGDWAKLFQKCPGYIKTELKQDIDNPNIFLTIDFWQSFSAFASIKQIIAAEYEDLDKRCNNYTLSEKHIGLFEMADIKESSTSQETT